MAKNNRTLFFVILTVAFLLSTTLNTVAYGDADFWIQTPNDWTENTEGLTNDLKKQVVSPDRNAFVEVYAASGNNPGLQTIADGMEKAILSRGGVYFQNRISSRNVMQDNHPAIFREYSSFYNGNKLHAYAIYAYAKGGAVVAIGVFAEDFAGKYQNLVYECINSLRFSPPPGMGSDPYGGSQANPYANHGNGCEKIIGKWRWFTGSQAEFYAGGRMPGNGNSWQCVDPSRGVVKIIWSNGKWVDTLTISADGSRLDGQNQIGNRVWGTRISAAAPPPPPTQPQVQQQPKPKMNYAKRIRGNLAASWRLAHGSLKAGTSDSRGEWELSTVSGTTLRFSDPYKGGKQSYRVVILTKDGQKVDEKVVGMSEDITVSPGVYKIRVFAEQGYAGWRCEWN